MAGRQRPGPRESDSDSEAVARARLALEREVKLAFASPEAARLAVETAGGRLVRSRRLIDDRLFDTDAGQLRAGGTALRVRRDDGRCYLTFKGRVVPGVIKAREELETEVGSADTLDAVLMALGFQPRFRAQKFRTEYELPGAHIALDETPMGVFVEIEGTEDVIAHVAGALGRSPSDYRLDSYPALWRRWCQTRGLPFGDMLIAVPSPPDAQG